MLLNAFFNFSPLFEINEETDIIEISLCEHNFLHLSDIFLKVNGKTSSLRSFELKEFYQSSILAEKNSFETWYKGISPFFSTRNEKEPSITIQLKESVFLEGLIIINRSDGLWERARELKIGVGKATNNLTYKVNLNSSKYITNFFENIDKIERKEINKYISKYGLNKTEIYNSKTESFDFLSAFIKSTDKNILPHDSNLFNLIIMNELVKQGQNGTEKLRYSIIMGIYSLLSEKKNIQAFKFFKFYRKYLESGDIENIKNIARNVGLNLYDHELVMGVHKFTRPIRSWKKGLLIGTLLDLTKIFQDELNIECMPFYGTLLGFYRDKDFIAADDDLDMLAITDTYSKEGLIDLSNRCIEILVRHGYKAIFHNIKDGKLPFVQVSTSEHDVPIDIFWGIVKKDIIAVPMDRMNYKDLEKSMICPVKKWNFENNELLAPNKIESWLEARYGQWKVPDPMFRANEFLK